MNNYSQGQMNYPMQNAYHLKGSPVQGSGQLMTSSQLSYGSHNNTNLQQQSQQQLRLHRSSLEDQVKIKIQPANINKRTNYQKDVQQSVNKVRESSEQKQPTKVETTTTLQNKSQLIYGSSNFSFMHFQTKQLKFSETTTSFKDMNIRISDMPGSPQVIFEDPNDTTPSIKNIRSPIQLQTDSNKEWTEILTKTRNLEENLLQLKNSINKNLKKIQRKKLDPKTINEIKGINDSKFVTETKNKNSEQENSILMIKIQENDLVYIPKQTLGSPHDSYYKQYLNTKQQELLDEQNRLSKESTQSKYSTQSNQANKNNIIGPSYNNKQKILFCSEGQKNDRRKASPSFIPTLQKALTSVNGAQSNHGLSHNPSMSSLSISQKLQTDRLNEVQKPKVQLQQRRDIKTSTIENLTKVQTISRINSPLQSKLGSKSSSGNQISVQGSSKMVIDGKFPLEHNLASKQRQYSQTDKLNVVGLSTQSKIFDPLYLPISPLKDRLVTGQFIGRGKFSDVFLAKDTFTGFHFALKVIRKETIMEFQMEDQLIREIKIQSSLDHPNIVKLYGTFYDDEKIYLAIEYCSDGELFQHQHRQPERKFDESKASQLIGQILDGINYMHDKGVMHRDLKTENILLSYDQIKLCDLGCVCDIGIDIKLRTTFCGTVDYIAPEVITGGGQESDKSLKGYDQRCDIWQVGVLAYELVVGKTPFTDQGPRNEDKIMSNILKKEVKFPDQISKDLKSFVNMALQKDPEKRITIREMLQHPWVFNYKTNQNFDINTLLNR